MSFRSALLGFRSSYLAQFLRELLTSSGRFLLPPLPTERVHSAEEADGPCVEGSEIGSQSYSWAARCRSSGMFLLILTVLNGILESLLRTVGIRGSIPMFFWVCLFGVLTQIGVVKIMIPFGVPEIFGSVEIGIQIGTINLTTTQLVVQAHRKVRGPKIMQQK